MELCLLALKLVSPTLHYHVSYPWRRAMPLENIYKKIVATFFDSLELGQSRMCDCI
jgi:hypothetical protein